MPDRARVLCVDDEPLVIEGITDNLRKLAHVIPATSGARALEILRTEAIDVIVSDMRMPGMDGATLLTHAREIAPDVPRVLLTGQADIASAIAAVNGGQLFRFLTKPCALDQLIATITAAIAQRQLLTAERELLEKTLRGSVEALVDILSLTDPAGFGRANRVRARVMGLCEELGLTPRWQVEMAALLQPIATITLPHDTLERMRAGHVLSADDKRMVARLPAVTEQLLAHIPRLEDVRAILAAAGRPLTRGSSLVEMGASILHVAAELEDLESHGHESREAAAIVRDRSHGCADALLAVLLRRSTEGGPRFEIHEVAVRALRVGMVFAEDVKMTSGTLLVARGYEVTASFIARVRNFPDDALRGPLRIAVRSP